MQVMMSFSQKKKKKKKKIREKEMHTTSRIRTREPSTYTQGHTIGHNTDTGPAKACKHFLPGYFRLIIIDQSLGIITRKLSDDRTGRYCEHCNHHAYECLDTYTITWRQSHSPATCIPAGVWCTKNGIQTSLLICGRSDPITVR